MGMKAGVKAGMNRGRVGHIEASCIKAMMPVLFRSVYGWRGKPAGAGEGEHFEIEGIDGSRLQAVRFRTAHVRAKGIVLLCHPFLKYGMGYFARNNYQRWLNEAGYDAVAFNFKGFGESSVEGIAFSDDVYSAAKWIREQEPGLPLHLLATSFGGYHGIHALARREMRFSSLVFDSVPVRISGFFNAGVSGTAMRWLSHSRWGRATGAEPLDESLPALNGMPSLFLYGANDSLISGGEISLIGKACPHARIALYENCGHLELRKAWQQRYMADILEFFDMHGVRCGRPASLNG